MPAVLVHGVPETHRLWDAVAANLHRDDVVALSLPGFGCPVPSGFEPTKDGYVAWLISELEAISEPVDLVGHDWGGGFVVRLVSLRPDLVRTWATDAAGLADIEFEWHQFAKIWQTPDEGEAFWAAQLASTAEQRSGMLTGAGTAQETALAIAEACDQTMADSILSLYRSAATVQDEWGPDFVDIPKPGLVIVPVEDPFLREGGATRAAEKAGASIARLEGRGHWWMAQDPAGAAVLLEEFWASVS